MKNFKWTQIVIIIFILFSYIAIPEIRENVNYILKLLKELKLDELKEYIISFGFIGPIVSIFILILQCMIAPLPLSIIVFANSYIYGWKVGCIISCIGTLIGSCISFFISRIYGRPIAEKFVSAKVLNLYDEVFVKYGKKMVYASRLLPFISFDGFSYAAGLTKMDFNYFFWATAIGQVPIIIALSLLGSNIGSAEKFIKGIIYCSIATLIAMIICYIVYRRKYNGISIIVMVKQKYRYYKKGVKGLVNK